ncbi:MAG: protoheme IX farnesyltransferase [Alphaproteobacteria bacterium]|nr:protoheme IX farnesyltransferase [Alphaproteobacteria bacterium]
MTDAAFDIELSRAGRAEPGDYVALLKPRVMSLAVFTSLVGLAIAPGAVHPVLGAVAVLAIAVGAGAAGALNMWYDADIDALMARTAARPIPQGRVAREEALAFGLFLSVFAVTALWMATNVLAAGLLAFTIFFYVVVYTMVLKRRTPQNIVIGGAAGALPPVIGWAAATGHLSAEPLVLFLIVFLWTPPHFWALALVRSSDYARAGVPMLPNVAGEAATWAHILGYALALVPASLLPLVLGFAGPLYGLAAAGGGAAFLYLSWRLARRGAAGDAAGARIAAKRLFAVSILYLFLLFATLLAEAILGLPIGAGP